MPRKVTIFEQKAEWMRQRQSDSTAPASPALPFAEQHYSIAEVAAMWSLSQGVRGLGGWGATPRRGA
jgi:hypothetical protein